MTHKELVYLQLWIARDLALVLKQEPDQTLSYAALMDELVKALEDWVNGFGLLSKEEQI